MSTPFMMIGRRLSHYEILDEISRGGMGVVYRAVDVNLGREVALKVLPDELVHDAGRRQRLLQEARAASTLEHPHIAVIHEVGEAEGITFIAMELIRGEKLSQTLSRGPLLQTRALDLGTEIAEGLARAHEKGVIHRDLKPANVMLTDEGHAKIIDFGLAKLVEPINQEAATATAESGVTNPGLIVGTAAYMSPEQARAGQIDHRTDVFSFGLVLFEMVTGRAAFQGQSTLDTLHAILTQAVPALPLIIGASSETTNELQRIIGKCTGKDPHDRYQGMKDLVVDLRAARRHLESGQQSTAVAPPVSAARPLAKRTKVLAAAAVAIAVVVAVTLWWTGRGRQGVANRSGKPAVAVLYFENNTGDASLDWMRTGLTDMMVTDLSQSTEIEVLGTDRLQQILQELKRADDRVISADVVQQIVARAGVDNVLVGSYVRAGDTIRITARLQEARSGRIVSAERVEGAGEASLFSLIDELTRRFKAKMAALGGAKPGPLLTRPGEPAELGLDRGLTEVTTSSIEAYRYYAEGIHLHERFLEAQAEPLLGKAIEIDPNFAMAYAKLAVVNNNLGMFDKRDEFAKRALERIDRLTSRERYYIEGFYYSNRPETVGRAIEAYKQGLGLHPEHQASRHNLGLEYLILDRFPEAIEQYTELIRRGTSNPISYGNLAQAYYAIGETGRAVDMMRDFVGRYPENAAGLVSLGETLVAHGQLEEARTTFEKAEALDPQNRQTRAGRRNVALLQQRWTDAEAVGKELMASPLPVLRFQGHYSRAQLNAARGRSQQALDMLDRGARLPGLSSMQRATARNRQAQLLLRLGKTELALAQVQLALPDARNREPEFETLRLLAITQATLGRMAESDKTLELLVSRAKALPTETAMLEVHWARGEIGLARGDTGTALAELTKAFQMLPVHGPVLLPPLPTHPDLCLAVAVVNLKAGRDAEAARALERLQAGYERVFSMDAYGRSLYLLGQIYERRGDTARAREQYARFVDLWRDGDAERGWVAEAQKKITR